MNVKKAAALLLVCLFVLACGCSRVLPERSEGAEEGGESSESAVAETRDYPELGAANIDSLELIEAANARLSVRYSSDEWYADESSDPLTLYYQPMMESGRAVNINVQRLSECGAAPLEDDMNAMLDEFREGYPYLSISSAEMRTLCGDRVILMDAVMQFTDQTIDDMLAAKAWTQEWLDENGGREAMLAIPPADQLYLYAVRDGWMYLFVGTYYEPEQRAVVLNEMTVLAQTVGNVD